MYKKKIPETIDCGINVAIKVMGGKWKAWIIDCIRRGIKRPSALEREMREVSVRIIHMQLRELEECGVLYREVYAEVPLRVEYEFTEVGRSILPIIDQLEQWGTLHKDHVLGYGRTTTAQPA